MSGQLFRMPAFLARIRWSDRNTQMRAAAIVPIVFGLFSVLLGADTNWDLYNYHVYGPFALLNDKLDIDLAPAGFQGYFNPLLDLPVYLLNTNLPGIVAGFILGFLHGLCFVAVLGIVRCVLSEMGPEQRWLQLFIAAFCCLTPNFLTGIGNSMGDNTTALFSLFSIYVLVANWSVLGRWSVSGFLLFSVAGLLAGLAVGLKLTNGVSALAICIALLCYPAAVLARLRGSFIFGLGVLAGTALTGGYWMFEMWTRFGNPLFPQFNSIFPNELAQPSMVADMRWLPQGLAEYLLWPFIFSMDSHRVGELTITQIIWPIAYVLFIAYILRWCWLKLTRRPVLYPDSRATFLLAFVAVGYLLWMPLFSIFRYTVAIEVLLPLAIFILLRSLTDTTRAVKLSVWILPLSTALMLIAGLPNWGHEPWAEPLYRVEQPVLEEPDRTTVLIAYVRKKRPLPWMVSQFSPKISFIGIENSFPGTEKYLEKARSMVRSRGGQVYVMASAETNKRARRMQRFADAVDWLGLTASANGCGLLKSTVKKLDLRATVRDEAGGNGTLCRLGLSPRDEVDVGAANREYVELARQMVGRAGFTLDTQSCATYAASIGGSGESYQFCKATLVEVALQPKR